MTLLGMAKTLQVLLLEDVPDLGRAGDIKPAAEGYARNFLFPQGKAAIATAQARHNREQRLAKEKKQKSERDQELRGLAEALEGSELKLVTRVKDGHAIYGKITAAKIAKEFKTQAKLDIKPKQVMLPNAITSIGEYSVTVRLSEDLEAVVHVNVIPET